VRDLVTTLLDVVGLLLVAAGLGLGLEPVIGPVAVAVAGLVVLGGSHLATRLGQRGDR
jgi:hypothetical protein